MEPRPILARRRSGEREASCRRQCGQRMSVVSACRRLASPSSGRITTLSTNTEGLMSGRYSTYSKLKIDYPHQRVLRITFNRPETYNSVDAETHTELTQ